MEEEISIDFKALFRLIWKEKWWILRIILLFGILGAGYAFMAREEFVSEGKILPEIQGKGSGSLGQFSGLAALAGVDLSSMGGAGVDAVRPDLYPDVITSTPFYINLFKAKVKTKENKEFTFEEYYHSVIEKGKEPEEELLEKYPVKEEGIIVFNTLNEIRLEELRNRITSSIDKKNGVISISVKMPDPVVAAETAKFAMEYLMEYVKNYRTEKLKKDIAYLEDQLAVSRGKFYSTQEKKARYSDSFQDMRLQSADVQRERIESEYRLSSSFYNELLKRYEEAKFKLQQETPVFQVLEPPVASNFRSAPKRIIIMAGALFVGGVIALIFLLLRRNNYNEVLIKHPDPENIL
jgi:uncharacterized protein involved in exopolysaccharide biosynthesis